LDLLDDVRVLSLKYHGRVANVLDLAGPHSEINYANILIGESHCHNLPTLAAGNACWHYLVNLE